MKTNIFNLKKLKKDNIILAEERSPLINFFIKYRVYILLLLFLLALITVIIGVYYAVKDLQDSTKVVTNISTVVVDFEDTNKFNSVNMKPITGGLADKIFYNRYGNVGLKEGVILLVDEFDTQNGHITYYSDGSAKIERNNNTIARISALSDGTYGINKDGVVVIGATIKEISKKDVKTLADGTKITYYSDNSSEIILPNTNFKMLVRNSGNIVLNTNRFTEIIPSGVTKTEEIDKDLKVNYYEDGTIKIEKDNEIYIVRNEEDVIISNNDITFPNNNFAKKVKNLDLKDGSKLIYYSDGSAEIIKNSESIMVRKSKDIIYNNNSVIEITETKYANVSFSKTTLNNEEVLYLDNGGAIIKKQNGKYEYIYENSDIKYSDNDKVKDNNDFVKEKNKRTTPDGTVVIDLEDKNSIIISEDGYRIVKTENIVYDGIGNIVRIIGDEDDIPNEDSVSENRFVITNSSGKKIKYIIALETTDDYKQYASKWLDVKFLRFNLVENTRYFENQTFGDKKLEIGTVLEDGTKIERETYILFESTIEKGEKAEINMGIWLDYTDITNDYQDSIFAGTIKVYSETIE